MKFTCSIRQTGPGAWQARHVGLDPGPVVTTGRNRQEALDKLKNELRYRLELCPCTGEAYRDIELELVESVT